MNMVRAIRTADGETTAFNPSTGEILDDRWSGQRRTFKRTASVLWNLPEPGKPRFDAFDAWYAMAAQVLHKARASFQVIAAFKILFIWKAGEITATDIRFTHYCGGCSDKTVSRIIGNYLDLGIIQIEPGWRVYRGKRLRTRIIRLAAPVDLPPVTIIPDDDSHTDHSGPDEAVL